VYPELRMSCVTLTYELWTQVKVIVHRLNEDNINFVPSYMVIIQ